MLLVLAVGGGNKQIPITCEVINMNLLLLWNKTNNINYKKLSTHKSITIMLGAISKIRKEKFEYLLLYIILIKYRA